MPNAAMKILLVEDNPADAYLLQSLIGDEEPSFQITHVASLSEAQKALQDPSCCQAILLDLSLPDSSGLETLDAMLLLAPDVAILVLTGLDDPTLGTRAVKRGAQDFLIKSSVNEALLVRAIHYAVERKYADVQLRKARDELEQRVAERTSELRLRAKQLSRLASEVTLAEQRERQRMAQVLHDHLQQILASAKLRLEMMNRQEGPQQRETADHLRQLLDESIQACRLLTAELSPPILHQAGLGAGLKWLARWMAQKHGLHVDLVLEEDAEPHRQDLRVLLFQSVRELLFNIVKHAATDKACVKLLRHDEGDIWAVVRDHGQGFDPAIALADEGDQMVRGFGLFSIRERLLLMGGCMEIDSAPGRGTCITLIAPVKAELPMENHVRAAAPAAAAAYASQVSDKSLSGKARILLVDDHAVMREGLSQLLRSERDMAVVGQAIDGQDAIEQARRLRPDIILMDYSMPRMDGLEATRVIHAEHPDIAIIGLSMFEESDRSAAMLSAGAVAYLAKSGGSDTLLTTIRKAAARA